VSIDRLDLLERYGRLYGELGLAIAFTATIDSTKGDVKACRTKGWQKTPPLPSAAYGAGLLRSGGQRGNPVVVLRPSRLIGIDVDTPEGLAAVNEMDLPATVTVRSSADYKRHLWYRWPRRARVRLVPLRAGRDYARERAVLRDPAGRARDRRSLHVPRLAPGA
jgi:hypothetical protein